MVVLSRTRTVVKPGWLRERASGGLAVGGDMSLFVSQVPQRTWGQLRGPDTHHVVGIVSRSLRLPSVGWDMVVP